MDIELIEKSTGNNMVKTYRSILLVISLVTLNCLLVILFDLLDLRTSILKTLLIVVFLFIYFFKYHQHSIYLSISNIGKQSLLLFIFVLIVFVLFNLPIDFSQLTFESNRFVKWLWSNSATAIYEELLLRGVCLALLIKGFSNFKHGIIVSIVLQAFIFGSIHMVNIAQHGVAFTLFQIIFATIVGCIFGALTVYYASLWPAVMIHFINNGLDSLNQYFGGQNHHYSFEMTLLIFAVLVLIAILCLLAVHKQIRKKIQVITN